MMETLTPKQRDIVKAGGILAAFLLILAAYYFFGIVQPDIARCDEEIAKVKKEVDVLKSKLADMDAAAANLKAMEEKKALLTEIAKKLPNSIDAPAFLQAMVDILTATRVEYQELSPGKEMVRNVYTEIPYAVKCRARYHDFGQFLNLIEENPKRFMRVKTFTIENNNDRPSVHPISVGIATFMFNSRG